MVIRELNVFSSNLDPSHEYQLMTHPLHAPDDKLTTMTSLGEQGAPIPASLKAEYDELFLKREQLRAKLEQARDELATLKAKGKAI
jgi:hypothetical protein